MPSITIWNRLEPRCRTQDLTTGLEARVHDPLWLLARQWQVGEFVGCDGGSPINAQVQWTTSSFDRYACGTGPTHPYDGTQPIEVLVERETVRPTTAAADIQQTAEAGLHFLRLLDAANLGRLRPAYLKQYPLAVPSDSDTDSLRLGSIVVGRVINGVQLYADLVTSSGQPNPALTLDAADSAAVLPITKTWMTWFQALFSEPIETVPWSPERMEYGFMLGAAADSAALVAQEYDGGEVDWYTFDRSFSSTLTSSSTQSTSTTRTIPVTPVTFVGMPARRFWEMEDAAVDIGALTAGAQDLGRLLLREFALIYGNDWFQFPLVLPAGCQASITSLVVSDTFGVTTTVPHYATADGATSSWRIFAMGPDGLPNTPNLLVVPPNGVGLLNSASVEDVLLLRDELAEMAWGVEHSAVGPSGTTIDRVLAWKTGQPPIPPPTSNNTPAYRLGSTVPDYWIPFLPAAVDNSALQMRRGIMPTAPGGVMGKLIAEPGLTIPLEELPKEGVHLQRRYRYARGADGSTYVWIGRLRSIGTGEGRSGLRFDYLDFSS